MINQFTVVTDLRDGDSRRHFLEHIIGTIEEHTSWSAFPTNLLPVGDQRLLSDVEPATKEQFMEKYTGVAQHIDKEEIKRHAQFNDTYLHRALDQMSVEEALWASYARNSEGNWDSVVNYFSVLVDNANTFEFPHVVEVLFDHNVVALDFGNEHYIPHHLLGRGFIAEGAKWPIHHEGKDTGASGFLIPMKLVENQTVEEQENYARFMIYHEILGHHIQGLGDHDIDSTLPEGCMMKVPLDRREIFDYMQRKEEPWYCASCTREIATK